MGIFFFASAANRDGAMAAPAASVVDLRKSRRVRLWLKNFSLYAVLLLRGFGRRRECHICIDLCQWNFDMNTSKHRGRFDPHEWRKIPRTIGLPEGELDARRGLRDQHVVLQRTQ